MPTDDIKKNALERALETAERLIIETPRPRIELETVRSARQRQIAAAILDAHQAGALERFANTYLVNGLAKIAYEDADTLRATAKELREGANDG